MKNWLVIPITKEELCKIVFIATFMLPPLIVIYMTVTYGYANSYLVILVFWIFPLMFLGLFKDEYDWDFGIKVKFFEGPDE